MRLLFLWIALSAFFCPVLSAQEVKTFLSENEFSVKGIYRFSSFNDGTVVSKNGIIYPAKLNYNISLDEMHFISQNGDTLSLADPATIDFISLYGTRFYYDKDNGYMQSLDTAGNMIMAFKQTFIAQQEHAGAYGATTPHEGARTYTYFNSIGQEYKLGDDEKIKVATREYYFFGDQYGHFKKAGKEFIFDHYPKNLQEIKSFLKTNNINFNKIEDLIKLFQYCKKLNAWHK